jgi:hypothetical protein
LFRSENSGGRLTLEAPTDAPETSVYEIADSWFAERSRVLRKFNVIHATIALHFECKPDAKQGRAINIELTKPNSSNLKSLTSADRQIAESHVARWGLA